jgi:hypothetical protein
MIPDMGWHYLNPTIHGRLSRGPWDLRWGPPRRA